MAEPVHLDIQDCDLSPQTYCHSGCIQPGRSSTYDGNLAWVCAGYAAQELSPASLSGLQMMSSRLHGQAARYLTHRGLSLIHISEPTRLRRISYAVFCLKKKKKKTQRKLEQIIKNNIKTNTKIQRTTI